jgi:MarR family transcriptional regulator, 2-MHQ and catechol-resistance regulon repressor
LSTQQLTSKAPPSNAAFESLLGAYASLTREISAALVASHGLTINDYGCLLLLSRAGEEGMRRIDLAKELQLSPSGITRLLDRLEDQGLVGKGECKEDARVSYAILTEVGLAKIKEAWPEHIDAVEQRVSSVLSNEEIETLNELLSRLSDVDPSCSPGDEPGRDGAGV